MPDLKAFQDAHPRVELEVETSYAMADLSRREADVAVRCTNSPSEDLVGRRLMHHASAAYASLEYLTRARPREHPCRLPVDRLGGRCESGLGKGERLPGRSRAGDHERPRGAGRGL